MSKNEIEDVLKPIPKKVNRNGIARVTSEGHDPKNEMTKEEFLNSIKKTTDIIPEKQTNEESKNDLKSKTSLDIHAKSFIPKKKTVEQKPTNEQTFQNKHYENNQNYKQNNQVYQTNGYNSNFNYQNNYPNYPNFQKGYVPNPTYNINKQYYTPAYPNMPNQYNNYNLNKSSYFPNNHQHNNYNFNPNKNQIFNSMNLTETKITNEEQKSKLTKELTFSKPFIPKSKRNSTNSEPAPPSDKTQTNNEQNETSKNVYAPLNVKAKEYIPSNIQLREKEEEQKRLRDEEEKHKNENKKTNEEKLKEEIEKISEKRKENKSKEKNKKAKEDKLKNEINKVSEDKSVKKINEDISKKTNEKTNEDKSIDENKKKSKLFALLDSKDEIKKTDKKDKEDKEDSPKNKQTPIKKKKVDAYSQRYNNIQKALKIQKEKQEKERKKKEEEDRKEKEEKEKKRKEEEERKRKEKEEAERIRKEKQKKEEEERIKKEMEEKKRIEEERELKEMEEKKRIEEEKNKVIENKYFIIYKNRPEEKKEYKYSLEYLLQFRNWEISKETELLTEITLQHFESFNEEEKEYGATKKKKNDYEKDKNKNYYNKNKANYDSKPSTNSTNANSNNDSSNNLNDMGQWARKDLSNEIKAADEFKKNLDEEKKKDPIKWNLRELLNMLTKDNYPETKSKIFEVIKENIEYQEKFLDVLFQKAVHEKSFVKIYAQLCKELDKELPQRTTSKDEKKNGVKKKSTSIMRTKLLDKCRAIFQIKNNEKFDEFIKVKDPSERENKLKKFILGNVNFITELINIQILSKKIAPQCINNLFDRYENNKSDEKLRLINVEAIIIFTDKFGTLVNQNPKIKPEDQKMFKENIDNILQRLEKIKQTKGLPSHIFYAIVNLVEKKKNGWNLSKLEKYIEAKSKAEVEKQFEEQDKITQDIINEKIKNDLVKYKDFVKEEGNSSSYPWKIITFLYEDKKQSLDNILEGYIVGCSEFIDNRKYIKYAKQYIKELFDFYKVEPRERKTLINRVFELFPVVVDFALDNPDIYIIYSYVLFIFIDTRIMHVEDLEKLVNEDSIEDDIKIVSNILKKVCKLMNDMNTFINMISEFKFVEDNEELFGWMNEELEPEEEEKDEKDDE